MNKYTLLAGVALLSIVAMAANAEPISDGGTIKAEVTLQVVPTITGGDTLNFGAIQVLQDSPYPTIVSFTAIIDASEGDIIIEKATALSGHERGSLEIQGINVLTENSSGTVAIEFTDIDNFAPATGSGSNAGCSGMEVTNITSNLVNNIVTEDGTYYFGGTLLVDSSKGGPSFDGPSLRCVGTGTATLVYTE